MIKFRAWEDRGKEYIKDVLIGSDGQIYFDDGVATQDDLDIHVEQFTGLKDVKGNEIYEGDIVKWGDMVGFSHEKPVRIATVKFNPDICFDSNVGIFSYGNFAYKATDKYLTVIGNIHDNPELLEEEK